MDPTLANILAQYEPARQETVYGPFGEKYDVEPAKLGPDPLAFLGARFGFRGMPRPAGPWSPAERAPPAPAREWKQAGDDSLGQQAYEALLGRSRDPGDAVANHGISPWLQGLLAALGAYGGYKGWSHLTGIDLNPADLWRDWQHLKTTGVMPQADPSNPKYDPKTRDQWLGTQARFDANREDRTLSDQLGLGIGFLNRLQSPAAGLTEPNALALDRRRLPGGVGKEPY